MKRFIILIILALYADILSSNEAPILSNSAEISLLTCSPGEELYSLFGHSAMRVFDPEQSIDVVFNYGTFSFNEDFYFNFTMGRLNYKLSVSGMDRFVGSYEYEGRSVSEQVLQLDSSQKQAVFNFLNWNYQPENRYYLYDFFYDNCSSRLRDVIEKALPDDQIEFSEIAYTNEPSFRNLIDSYLIYHPWGDFGIDLGLGLPCDKVPSAYEYMFLPYELERAMNHASINNLSLVKSQQVLVKGSELQAQWSIFNPAPLFWAFLGLITILSAVGMRKKRLWRWIDVVFFVVTGSVGLLIFFLWFITDHNATVHNFNMLWAWPTHLLAIPLLFIRKARITYWAAYGIVLTISLIAFSFLPQSLHLATIPLMLVGILRSAINVSWHPQH